MTNRDVMTCPLVRKASATECPAVGQWLKLGSPKNTESEAPLTSVNASEGYHLYCVGSCTLVGAGAR